MYIRDAKVVCPELTILPYDFEEIESCSDKLLKIMSLVTPRILPTSIDEAYLQLVGEFQVANALFLAQWIRSKTVDETQCTVSIGVGDSLLTSKIASQLVKKSKVSGASADLGIVVLPEPSAKLRGSSVSLGQALEYISSCIETKDTPSKLQVIEECDWRRRLELTAAILASLPVKDLHGIGRSAEDLLSKHGVVTCGDCLKVVTLTKMQELFGKQQGSIFHEMCKGIDRRPIPTPEQIQGGLHGIGRDGEVDAKKTLTIAVNWGVRLFTEDAVLQFMDQMATETASRIEGKNIGASFLTVKVSFTLNKNVLNKIF
eukprot:Gregarina_sp_Poly_1__584@NODE_1139_length_4971_cov_35_431688_g785_i0_p3_GENE_NODE_1139_length_4971_cov_35_431688_g785_i0NODE_1139_length_4971_cov_35_431688_g785_i0_p3_ORF_typecomplete_len316_score52_41IMS/PF00817_20/9_8e18IMS_HHH/PF11798_8/6_6e05IMS_HHH/PF11798_8/2_4e03IMS_C/PF11799_8/2_9e03IMS_C/PF11799_8/0_52_NODE_1139_length_4971_cov_35_431688_g785_i023053252